MTHVKVCCIGSVAEARAAVRLGAGAVGLVSEMPSGPGVISEALIAEIAAEIGGAARRFLLTSKTDPADIAAQQRRCGVDTVQICDRLAAGALAELRAALPGVWLVQVIHVRDRSSVEEALEAAKAADALLLDSGNQSLAVKELGGTGRTHDWALSAEIAAKAGAPVFLAGGLNPGNVAEAIRTVRPYGVDVCSGVRTGGALDEEKLASFVAAVAGA